MEQYPEVLKILNNNGANTNINERKKFAVNAFNVSSHYTTTIFNYFNTERIAGLESIRTGAA